MEYIDWVVNTVEPQSQIRPWIFLENSILFDGIMIHVQYLGMQYFLQGSIFSIRD